MRTVKAGALLWTLLAVGAVLVLSGVAALLHAVAAGAGSGPSIGWVGGLALGAGVGLVLLGARCGGPDEPNPAGTALLMGGTSSAGYFFGSGLGELLLGNPSGYVLCGALVTVGAALSAGGWILVTGDATAGADPFADVAVADATGVTPAEPSS